MLDLAEALKAEIPRRRCTARSLCRGRSPCSGCGALAVWGSSAACALLVAVLASRTPTGAERMTLALNGGDVKQAEEPPPAFNAEAATERLGQAVRGLAANDAEIKTRLAAVEQDMTDVTGSVTKQIAAARAAGTTRRSDDGPTVMATAAETTALATPDAPPRVAAALLAAIQPPVGAALPTTPHAEFGVDIGSGLTISGAAHALGRHARRPSGAVCRTATGHQRQGSSARQSGRIAARRRTDCAARGGDATLHRAHGLRAILPADLLRRSASDVAVIRSDKSASSVIR